MNDYTEIGMKKCNNANCPTHTAWHKLRKHGLAFTIKYGSGITIETSDNPWIDDAYDKIKAHFTTNGVVDHKAIHVYIETVMRPLERLYASMYEMNHYRSQTGHLGYLVEKEIPDTAELHEVSPMYSKERAYTCPYCGSSDVVWDTGRKITEYYNYKELEVDEVPTGSVSVKRRDPRTKEWYNEVVDITPNDECDYETEYQDILNLDDNYEDEGEFVYLNPELSLI